MHIIFAFMVSFYLLFCGESIASPETGLTMQSVPFRQYGPSIMRQDFNRCTPAYLIKEKDLTSNEERWIADGPENERQKGNWLITHSNSKDYLLGAEGTPPDLIYPPDLVGLYNVFVGLRRVGPNMKLGIRLAGEKNLTVIKGFAFNEEKDFDWEFEWKDAIDLSAKNIILSPRGTPLFVRYLRFTPVTTGIREMRCTTDRVTILKSPGEHFAFPGVAKLDNGEIAVVCRQGKGHECPFGGIVLTKSKDGGRTWSKPVCIYNSALDDRNPSILKLPDGRVHVSLYTSNWARRPDLRQRYPEQYAAIESLSAGKNLGPKVIFSDNNGHTRGEPIKLPCSSPHGPILGPNGDLWWTGRESGNGRHCHAIYHSNTGGRKWRRYARISCSAFPGEDKVKEVFREPALAILSDGKWVATMRVNLDGYVRQTCSWDSGRHWTVPRNLKIRGKPHHLLPLKDGRLLMTYGHRFFPLGIRACVSSDGGRTWDLKNEIVLRHKGADTDLGYPVSIELDDGLVFTVYYYNNKEGDCYIEGAFYRP